MSDFTKAINGITYDGVIEKKDDFYILTLQTQPAFVDDDGNEIENPYEGFTAEKKYRLNMALHNPETLMLFETNAEVADYVCSKPDNIFAPWFDDPVEEESE